MTTSYNLTEKPILESDIKDINWEDKDQLWVDVETFEVTLKDGTQLTIDVKDVSDQQAKVICDWLFNNFEPVPDGYVQEDVKEFDSDFPEWLSEWDNVIANDEKVTDFDFLSTEEEEDLEDDEKTDQEWVALLAQRDIMTEVAKDLYEQYIDTLNAY